MIALDALEQRTGSNWAHIHAARKATAAMRAKLEDGLTGFSTQDTSIVVVGSLARQEFTQGSDVDWTLLLDGLSDPNHIDVANDLRDKIASLEGKSPGQEGTFGTLSSSHDLIHYIGGQGDTNANTTRRILLLLESVSIGRGEAHQRVLKNVLSRYLEEDRGLWYGSSPYKIPRFLFNDVSRYWRTMAVDFAYKQRSRPGGDFALKNFKLRMSRKLIYIAGMIACFECHLGFDSDEARNAFYKDQQVQRVIDLVHSVLSKPPLEILASALLRDATLDVFSKQYFDAYDEFLEMLSDEKTRDHLKKLPVSQLEDPVAKRYRAVAHRSMDAVTGIFLNRSNKLGELTIEYGVF
jgi:hypothetical protein